MPDQGNLSDFLFAAGGRAGQYVELINNATNVAYISLTQTDANGKYTIPTPPGGYYSVYLSAVLLPANDPGWIFTGDSQYVVPYTAGDNMVGQSITTRAVGPFSASGGAAGSIAAAAQIYPADQAGGIQVASGLLHSVGVPSNANGNNNDWCISDNGNLYRKVAGAWAAVQPGNPMTTVDDIIIGGASGVQSRLAKGANGTILNVDQSTGHVVWASTISPPGAIFPGDQTGALQTSSGLIHSTGVPSNANGSNGWWCISDNGNLYQKVAGVWNVVQPGNPMTTLDDVIVGGASGVQTRLAKGASGAVLSVDPVSGHVAWDLPTSVTPFAISTANLAAVSAGTTGTSSNGSVNVTSVTTVASPGDVGKMVTGPGVLPNTFIVSAVTNTSFVLSQAAGAGAGTGTFTFNAAFHETGHDTWAGGSGPSPYTRFRAFAAASVKSFALGLTIDQSDDNATWYSTAFATVYAGLAQGTVLEEKIVKRYVRASYTNENTVQAGFNFSSALVS